MIRKLIKKGLAKNKIMYFPNWVDIDEIQESTVNNKKHLQKRSKDSKKAIVIQYSGTLNKKQGLNLMLEVIRSCKGKNIYWLIACEDHQKNSYKLHKEISNIKILKLQKRENMSEWLNTEISYYPQKRSRRSCFSIKILPILASGSHSSQMLIKIVH